MAGEVVAPEKGPNPWGQAIAALVVVGVLGGGLYVIQKNDAEAADKPAVCSADEQDKKAANDAKAAHRVSGTELCTALNRADLPTLLGTPREHARTAYGSDGSVEMAGGTKIHPLIFAGNPGLQAGRECGPRCGGAKRRRSLRLRGGGQAGRFWLSM
ncbi:DUF6215 domain-containing protein [Streptomyces sp. NBC_00289]|uniref:DUF6215 domain-containing protein n=1 Tax=Streptomyces sp. NBC_00289 TaxID=2975703 RepID=UPI00324EBF47